MEKININQILGRTSMANQISSVLKFIDKNKQDCMCKRGIYLYGNPGTGKTSFITSILAELNYDMIHYSAGDIRNKSIIETITQHNMADTNVLSLLQRKSRKIVIVMDEIDGMNNGDKGGITSLIKLIRPKKTKKQRLEEVTLTPIICIGNYHMDKKIKELMKVCHTFELIDPSIEQMDNILDRMIPCNAMDKVVKENIITYIQGDLRKLKVVSDIYIQHQHILQNKVIKNIFQTKTYNEDSKTITLKLIRSNYTLKSHVNFMNETDRTIVGLLWHENIVDYLGYSVNLSACDIFAFYEIILDNICFADYIDRVTFQKQIWQFNEMSSLIKTFYNNELYHCFRKIHSKSNKKRKTIAKRLTSSNEEGSTIITNDSENAEHISDIKLDSEKDIRFTKVLTKYSTEYNNYIFIQNLCLQMLMDKNDLITYFLYKKQQCLSEDDICLELDQYSVSKLDVSRMFRYIDKYDKDITVDK